MALTVYALCALTSLACALLLLRGFRRSRARLLLWSGLCFAGLFINNALLVVDSRIGYDLSITRSIPAVLGVLALMYGLIMESDR